MPVPPRRKTVRDLLVPAAPRDATETARQGQGIGDIAAMRQMATTVLPEMLRVAPMTSTPMSAVDAGRSLANKDWAGAGMAAIGMIPFAGMIDDVGKQAAKAMPNIGNTLDALKQFAADMAENTSILRKRAGIPADAPYLTGEEIRSRMDEWYKAAGARNAKLEQEIGAINQRINQNEIALQEATAFRRAVANDANRAPMELEMARKKEQDLRAIRKGLWDERAIVRKNNPLPSVRD